MWIQRKGRSSLGVQVLGGMENQYFEQGGFLEYKTCIGNKNVLVIRTWMSASTKLSKRWKTGNIRCCSRWRTRRGRSALKGFHKKTPLLVAYLQICICVHIYNLMFHLYIVLLHSGSNQGMPNTQVPITNNLRAGVGGATKLAGQCSL